MGFFSDVWDVVKDVGAAIVSGIIGTLVHYIYIGYVYIANILKPKKSLSDCLIGVLEELNLFSNNVDLSKVRIVENATGLAKLGLTNNYTIYFSSSIDEYDDLHILLHELRHVQQYQDWGYVVFVAKYDYQIVRYGYENAPIEIEARKFADDNYSMVRNKYDLDCREATDPESPIFKSIINEDWTMLLDLV